VIVCATLDAGRGSGVGGVSGGRVSGRVEAAGLGGFGWSRLCAAVAAGRPRPLGSGSQRDLVEPGERGDQLGGPWPVVRQAEPFLSAVGADESGGEHEGEPRLVDRERRGGEVREPGVFGVADALLDASSSPVESFEVGDTRVAEVGDHDLVAVPVDVGERELRAGVTRLATGVHLGSFRPAGEVDLVGDLDHCGVFTQPCAVGCDRRLPAPFRCRHKDLGDVLGETVPDDEANLSVSAGVEEVNRTGLLGASTRPSAIHSS